MIADANPYIVAEVGASHDGKFDTAIYLIGIARNAGCQAVKFQVYDSDILARRRHDSKLAKFYRPYQVPMSWLPKLRKKAHDLGLDFVLSVYHEHDLRDIARWADVLKVSSFECQDKSFLQSVVGQDRPVIISTGLCSIHDLSQLRMFRKGKEVYLLHCISAYPTPVNELCLSMISKYDFDGFSDHSGQRFTGSVAVGAGARIIEVHIRGFETPKDNPDYKHSLQPSELSEYVAGTNYAATAMGTKLTCRELTISEKKNVKYRVMK